VNNDVTAQWQRHLITYTLARKATTSNKCLIYAFSQQTPKIACRSIATNAAD